MLYLYRTCKGILRLRGAMKGRGCTDSMSSGNFPDDVARLRELD
jgi:hypothetical protein